MTEIRTRVVKAQLAKSDFAHLSDALSRRAAAALDWTAHIQPIAFAAGAFALVLAISLVSGFSQPAAMALAVLAAAVTGFVAAGALRARLAGRALRVDGAFLRPFRFSADQDGVTFQSDVSETRLRWAGVFAIELTPKLVLLYVDRANALAIPLSAFADPASMQAFAEELRFLRRRAMAGKEKVTPKGGGERVET